MEKTSIIFNFMIKLNLKYRISKNLFTCCEAFANIQNALTVLSNFYGILTIQNGQDFLDTQKTNMQRQRKSVTEET